MILENDNIKLRRFTSQDAERLVFLANNKNVSKNLRDAFPHPYTLKDAENFISNFISQEPLTIFAIEYNSEYVGNIGLMIGTDVYRKTAEIGYFIGEDYWGKGITTKAVNLITDYAFNKLNIVRIHTGVFEYNTASMKVLEKCGFQKEAIFKKSIYKDNKIWDEHRYALINPSY